MRVSYDVFVNVSICLSLIVGSMRKKRLVKKILSPIFKSNSQEEEFSNQVTSRAGEAPQTPEAVDGILPDLSPRLVDIDASLFAREITLIDKELFIRIPWPELANCGWMTKDKVNCLFIRKTSSHLWVLRRQDFSAGGG